MIAGKKEAKVNSAAPGSRYSTTARTTGVAMKAFCAWTRVHAIARKISGTRVLGPTFGGTFFLSELLGGKPRGRKEYGRADRCFNPRPSLELAAVDHGHR